MYVYTYIRTLNPLYRYAFKISLQLVILYVRISVE